MARRKKKSLEGIAKAVGRHTLGGFLPAKVQNDMAREHGEDPMEYWGISTITETIIGGALMVSGAAFPPLAIAGAAVFGDIVFNMVRGFSYLADKNYGHPVTTIPYHAVIRPTAKMGKYLSRKLSGEDKSMMELYARSPRKFKKRFGKMDGHRQEAILSWVMASKNRNDKVDKWLASNYPGTIKDLLYVERVKVRKKEEDLRKQKEKPKDELEDLWKALAGKE